MAEKQLTVAELMARAQQENPDTDAEGQPRRRRRRSIEEGGVTVAELTGSFKKVNARPAEVKHSSVPLDGEDVDQPESAETTNVAEPETHVEPEAPAVDEKVEPEAEAETLATDQPEDDQPVTLTKFRPVEPEPTQYEEPAQYEPVEPEPEEYEEPPFEAAQSDYEEDSFTLRKVSFVDDDQEDEVAEVADPEPATYIQPAVHPEPVENLVPEQSANETNVFPAIEDEAYTEQNTSTFAAPVRDNVRGDLRDDRYEDDRADGAVEPVYEDVATYDGKVEDNSVNPIMLVLLVFAGLILGVLIFLGFQYLWATLDTLVVAGLAAVATVGIVVLVRAMKTGRDGLTLTLAGLAGAVMTFGPALISVV